jgi:hypothetical protein
MKIAVNSNGGWQSAAAATLRSEHFFSILRGVLQGIGLVGKEEWMGLGVYFVATSRLQPYPLRLDIQERTEGTATYIVGKVSSLLPAGHMVTITPEGNKQWKRLAESPDQKIVFIPQWEGTTKRNDVRVEVRENRLIRVTPLRRNGRVVEQFDEVKGGFAFISGERSWSKDARWLTMVQPERQEVSSESPSCLSQRETKEWHQVQRLLEQRAQLPIVLPEWEQVVAEEMCERDDRALRHLPVVLQIWRTMSLIRSFQSEKKDGTGFLHATFEDLAAASLFARRVFKEGCWFPSCKKVFGKLGKSYDRTRVMHPVTGRPVVYAREGEREEAVEWGPAF